MVPPPLAVLLAFLFALSVPQGATLASITTTLAAVNTMTVSLPTTALLPMPSTEPVVCKCGSKEGQNWYPFATALLGAVAGLLGVVAAGISCFVAARYTYPAAKISLKLAEDQKKEGDKGKEPATGGGDT